MTVDKFLLVPFKPMKAQRLVICDEGRLRQGINIQGLYTNIVSGKIYNRKNEFRKDRTPYGINIGMGLSVPCIDCKIRQFD